MLCQGDIVSKWQSHTWAYQTPESEVLSILNSIASLLYYYILLGSCFISSNGNIHTLEAETVCSLNI